MTLCRSKACPHVICGFEVSDSISFISRPRKIQLDSLLIIFAKILLPVNCKVVAKVHKEY